MCERFTLLAKLGSGGSAEIWRARDEHRGAEFALKIVRPGAGGEAAAWASLEREHAIVSRLDHSGILRVFPPERCGEAAILPMELAAGGDLRRLRGESYLRIVPVLIELARSLGFVHGCGVVHRDLKPGNVLLDEAGRTKLADFGAAAIDAASGLEPALAGLPQRGSPFSASPQQLQGELPVPADDIYGLGALAYELLSGYPPHFPNFDARLQGLAEPVASLVPTHQIPPRLHALVMSMLAPRPEERPKSMRVVIDELQAALQDTLGLEAIAPAAPVDGPRPRAAAHARPGEGDWELLRSEIRGGDPRRRPELMRIEPVRSRRWPWFALAVLALLALGVFFWLPRIADQAGTAIAAITQPRPGPAPLRGERAPAGRPQETAPGDDADARGSALPREAATTEEADVTEAGQAGTAAAPEASALEALGQRHAAGSQRLEALETRAAALWGGAEFAAARAALADAAAATEVGDAPRAAVRLEAAEAALQTVDARADEALAAQLEAGERALTAGQSRIATQAFEIALKIDPINRRATAGLARAGRLDQVLALIARAENAQTAGDAPTAAQLFERALALDPANERARAGLALSRSAAGADAFARALGEGYAALVAGRLEEARAAFTRARTLRPGSREAQEGLSQVAAAREQSSYSGQREQLERLEAEERWSEALAGYERILAADPTLEFARAGRARVAPRAELGERLQRLIDRPERLAAPEVRAEADRLLASARAMRPSGPVIRSQITRLEILLPDFDKPVRLAVESDNATQVSIQRVGTFGAFRRREIELRPGKYTLVGTREGFRDVRRDIVVAPGQDTQTIVITCVERI